MALVLVDSCHQETFLELQQLSSLLQLDPSYFGRQAVLWVLPSLSHFGVRQSCARGHHCCTSSGSPLHVAITVALRRQAVLCVLPSLSHFVRQSFARCHHCRTSASGSPLRVESLSHFVRHSFACCHHCRALAYVPFCDRCCIRGQTQRSGRSTGGGFGCSSTLKPLCPQLRVRDSPPCSGDLHGPCKCQR